MRNINTDIVAKLQSKEYQPFILLNMVIDSTHYSYTDCDVPIQYNGNLYSPRGMSIGQIQYSSSNIVDQVDITLSNLDDAFTSQFIGSNPQGETITLMQVIIDSDGTIVGSTAVTIFEGTIDSWEIDEEELRLTVSSPLVRWTQKTQSFQSALCRWKKFKGTECGYSGPQTWCDRTYSRCTTLGNTANFGGDRFLPSIIDKEIWWGQIPK